MRSELRHTLTTRTLRRSHRAVLKRVGLTLLLATAAVPLSAAKVASPDGTIQAELDVDNDGVPFYRVWKDGEEIIAESDLGFTFADAEPMRRNFTVEAAATATHDDTWEQPWGERRFVRDNYNELAVTLPRKSRDIEPSAFGPDAGVRRRGGLPLRVSR